MEKSEETRKKISAALTGKVQSAETRKKRSEAMKGLVRGPRTEEHKAKLSVAGKRRADIVRKMMMGNKYAVGCKWNVGRKASVETRQKMSAARIREIEWVVDNNNCHVCTSHKPDGCGYPVISKNGRMVHMHRWVYLQKFGSVEKGIVVRHKCDNKLCINVEHLESGTVKQNVHDAVARGQHPRGEKAGSHVLSELQVIELLKLKGKMSQRVAARMFGVSQFCVCSIWNRKSWRHVKVEE